MRGKIILLVILVCTVQIVAYAQNAVYRININGINGTRVQTGFKLKNEKGIITALHGVAGYEGKISVTSAATGKTINDNIFIVKVDIAHDICVISSKLIDVFPSGEGYIANDKYITSDLRGKTVKVVGFPLGMGAKQNIDVKLDNDNPVIELQSYLPPSVAVAISNRKSPHPEIDIIPLHGSVVPGHSGAPVLYQDRVIGMADGGLKSGTVGFGWAIMMGSLGKLSWSKLIRDNEYNRLAVRRDELFSNEIAPLEAFNPDDYINKSLSKNDVAILIVDEEGRIDNTLASRIAAIYREQKLNVTTSLFKSGFVRTSYLDEIRHGNAAIIEQLNLPANTKFVVLGKFSHKFDTGSITKYISRPKLEISIISCISKDQVNNFTLSASYPSNFEDAAKNHAMTRLMANYKADYSKIE